MEPNIGIPNEKREAVVKILNTILADEVVVYTKTRNYHWNIIGMQFIELHKFFESQYEELNNVVDDIAERIRTLGGRANGTLNEFLKQTRLKEFPGQSPDAQEMIFNLLADHDTIIRNLRSEIRICGDNYQDEGTCGQLAGLLEKHEKMAWMLRAHIEGLSV
jgi:starvation-inducible DNA-binding protein